MPDKHNPVQRALPCKATVYFGFGGLPLPRFAVPERLNKGGPPKDGPPTGGCPTGGLPTGGLPTGGLPTGGLPTGGLPTGGLPTGGLPTGGRPTGGRPTGGLPTGFAGSTGNLAGISSSLSLSDESES